MTTPTSSSRRPAPRRSSLTGSSPVTPPPALEPAPPVAVPPASAVEPTDQAPAVAPAAPVEARPVRKTKYPPKVSFYQDPADTSRVCGAILHTMVSEGSRSLSQFIGHAVMLEVARLEEKYNDGRPFPPVAPRELPQGRPMGE